MFHSTQKSPVAYPVAFMHAYVFKAAFIQYLHAFVCRLKAAFHTFTIVPVPIVPVPVREARSEFSTKNLRSNH